MECIKLETLIYSGKVKTNFITESTPTFLKNFKFLIMQINNRTSKSYVIMQNTF